MELLKIEATARTPAVSFDYARRHLKLSGESYPEDVTSFFNPLFAALDDWLKDMSAQHVRFDFELIYFNSSSAKAIMMLMEKLDEAAAEGNQVDVHWFYDAEDETMQELGEEFGEDLKNAAFHLETLSV